MEQRKITILQKVHWKEKTRLKERKNLKKNQQTLKKEEQVLINMYTG